MTERQIDRASESLRVVGYVRVSTDEQGRSGLGLADQRQAIETECERRGWTVEIREEIRSGASVRKRPVLGEILGSLERGDTLIVAKLDRLTRSLLDFATIAQDSSRGGWRLVILDQGFEIDESPSSKALLGMLAVFAEWERGMCSQRTRSALAAARARGVRLGNPNLRPVPAALTQRIIGLRAAGLSFSAIARQLNAEGIAGAQGGTWHGATVSRILRREAAAKAPLRLSESSPRRSRDPL
jgi:DNA invertase Pin-like site-specific DNA recombinase